METKIYQTNIEIFGAEKAGNITLDIDGQFNQWGRYEKYQELIEKNLTAEEAVEIIHVLDNKDFFKEIAFYHVPAGGIMTESEILSEITDEEMEHENCENKYQVIIKYREKEILTECNEGIIITDGEANYAAGKNAAAAWDNYRKYLKSCGDYDQEIEAIKDFDSFFDKVENGVYPISAWMACDVEDFDADSEILEK